MVKKIRCEMESDDYIRVKTHEEYVDILITNDGGCNMVRLTTDAAQKLRKQIKRAIKAIEGVEDEGEEVEVASNVPTPKFSVGDKVIITKEGSHGFRKGEEVILVRYEPSGFQHFEASNMAQRGWLGFDEFKSVHQKVKTALEDDLTAQAPSFPDWLRGGAIVEITDNNSYHGFKIGEKVRVGTVLGSNGASIRCDYLDGRDYWYVLPSDCKPA